MRWQMPPRPGGQRGTQPDIPHQPLALNYNNGGFVPHVGLHRRAHLFYQESSYSHFWLAGSMFLAAFAITLLPWHTLALGGVKLKYYVALIGIWGGICAGVPYFIRNKFGQTIIIDPKQKILSIRSEERHETIQWQDIIGLQICHERIPGNSKMTGYQLNLVWR